MEEGFAVQPAKRSKSDSTESYSSSVPETVAASVSARWLTSKPTLPELLNFITSSGSSVNIVQRIGTHYSRLGPLLLNDDNGSITPSITSQHQQKADEINQEILSRWLQGQGKQPVTWSTLADVLSSLGLSELADIIKMRYNLVTEMQDQIQALKNENAELRQQLDMKEITIRQLQEQETRAQQQLIQQEESSRERMKKLKQSGCNLLTEIQSFQKTLIDTVPDVRESETLKPTVSGPGLQSATANHPTHVIVELIDYCNKPCSVPQKVTAELELISKTTDTSPSTSVPTSIAATSPSQYKVSYTAISRGQYKLHIQINDKEISGSPFTMTVYPDPTQLAHPVKVVTGLDNPYGIAINSHGAKIVTQRRDNQNLKCIVGEEIQEYGDSAIKMSSPRGIAIDNMDRIYVTSGHKLHKFTSSGELIKSVGEWGSKTHFNDPRGIALYNNQVYVCDRENHCIQVFDLDLNFIKSIGSNGKGEGEFDAPKDVKFDSAGNMYVAEWNNDRVQVLNPSGQFIRVFGKEKLRYPAALHIIDKHVYVSNIGGDTIVVYDTSGKFIASFGESGLKEEQLKGPRSITSCPDGFIYVVDSCNGRIQIF